MRSKINYRWLLIIGELWFILAALIGGVHSAELTIGTMPERSSWRVRVRAATRQPNVMVYGYGSGTAIGPQAIVTAGHVVDWRTGTEVDLFRPDRPVDQPLHGHCIACVREPGIMGGPDVAVIKIDSASVADFVPVAAAAPKAGDLVYELGFGHRGEARTASGVVRSAGRYDFVSSIIIESGDSGCGVFDNTGAIVGVNTAARNAVKMGDGVVSGPSVSTGINWLNNFSNIDAQCPGGICRQPFQGIQPRPISGGSPMLPVQPYPGQPIIQPISQPIPVQPAVPAYPAPIQLQPASSARDDQQDQRIGNLEQWAGAVNNAANPLLQRLGSQPLPALPTGPQPAQPIGQAAAPQQQIPPSAGPSPDLSNTIKQAAEPIIQAAVAKGMDGVKAKLDDVRDKIGDDVAAAALKLPNGAEIKSKLDGLANISNSLVVGVTQNHAELPAVVASSIRPIIDNAIAAIGLNISAIGAGPLGWAAGLGAVAAAGISYLGYRRTGQQNPALSAAVTGIQAILQGRGGAAQQPQASPIGAGQASAPAQQAQPIIVNVPAQQQAAAPVQSAPIYVQPAPPVQLQPEPASVPTIAQPARPVILQVPGTQPAAVADQHYQVVQVPTVDAAAWQQAVNLFKTTYPQSSTPDLLINWQKLIRAGMNPLQNA